ncbi:MAG: DUF1657 domain-containing protein [Firmicutes bacterium]|nr:DUF1657 domain-containing protein [Bacillota bacterium]
MTVKRQLEQVIANAETLSGQLKSFALETMDDSVKQMYKEMSTRLDEMLPHLKGRLSHIMDEEPQYR